MANKILVFPKVADDGTQNGFMAIQIIDNGANYSLFILDQPTSGAPSLAANIPATGNPVVAAGGGGGDVVGPAASTDNALVRFDGATGKLLQNSAVTLGDTGVFAFPDGIRQTFNPDATTPGLNIGAQAGDPTTPADGDLWYNSTTGLLRGRANGATVTFGVAATPTPPGGADTQVQFNNAGAFGGDAGLTFNATTDVLVLTSAAAVAFATGAGGLTNPVFSTVNNVASQATGLQVQGNASGAGANLQVIGSGANEALFLLAKGNQMVSSVPGVSRAYGPGGFIAPLGGGFTVVSGATDAAYLAGGGLYLVSSDFIRWRSTTNLLTGAYDSGVARGAIGVVVATLGSGLLPTGWFVDAGIKRVSTQFDKTTDTALANVTGLSVSLQAGRTYSFEANLFITADVVGGSKFAVAGTATATVVIFSVELLDYGTNVLTIADKATALGGAGIGQAGTTSGRCRIKGLITVALAGTLTIQFAQNAATGVSSVEVGSDLIVRDNP